VESVFRNEYQVVRTLEPGGQSKIYCARRRSNGKYFVIKTVHSDSIPNLEENLRILQRLHHPQIPASHEIRYQGDEVYIVQDYFPGDSLKKILRDNRRMYAHVPWRVGAEWMLSACAPLEFVHQMKVPILHCDVKPGNLLLRSVDQQICLMDFDIARELTPSQARIGAMSMAYASPEQKQFLPLDQRTDIYSLGVTIYQLTAGCLPGERLLHWYLPTKFRRLLNRCIALNPDQRFQSVNELKLALRGLLSP
jgi:serine/threonine-protein kinase